MRVLRLRNLLLVVLWCVGAAGAVELSRQQALEALVHPNADQRIAGIERLADTGRMAEADLLLPRLDDPDPRVRAKAADAVWQIWSRSGDEVIDRPFARGVAQMQSGAFDDALATFNAIVARDPAFAEGWNKRATVYYLLGRNEESLKDCDEVFKRNPNHFGALSGAGQIHLKLGHVRLALDLFRRAIKVNPNLEGPAQMIPALERYLREKGGSTT